MNSAFEARGGTWFGRGAPADSVAPMRLPFALAPIGVTAEEVSRYEDAFSNQMLLPVLHSLARSASSDAADWRAYESVNERFARAILDAWTPGDVAWIHDYHLLRVPHHLRRLGFRGEITSFVHVPFPHVDAFRGLPWAKAIIEGLLACDLVGFSSRNDAVNFLGAARSLGNATVSAAAAVTGRHRVEVGAFPIGIDAAAWERLAADARPEPSDAIRTLLAVDRLDCTGAIPQRLLAYERFLERHPEHHGKVRLRQVILPGGPEPGHHGKLEHYIAVLMGRIRRTFATARWIPSELVAGPLAPSMVAALHRQADILLASGAREDRTLARQFVACQGADPGVLLLTSTARSARDMRGALLADPQDSDATAEAIHAALSMPAAERADRMQRLREHVRLHDVRSWAANFLGAARDARATFEGTSGSEPASAQAR